MDKRSRLSIKFDALQRLLMNNMLSGILPLYIVTEYPKSGGTWVGQMLSAYLGVPFPRNGRPKLSSCVMHGHYGYTPFMRNVLCVVRDGRDVAVSAYYHMLFPNEHNSPHLIERTRHHNPFKNYDDITENLPAFIEYLFRTENRRLMHVNWSQFVDSWLGKPHATLVKYEDALHDAAQALRPYIEKTVGKEADMKRLRDIQETFSFKRQSRRTAGEEVRGSFLRKGIAGDWKTKFSTLSCEVFDHYAGANLVNLGYEKDRTWVASWTGPMTDS